MKNELLNQNLVATSTTSQVTDINQVVLGPWMSALLVAIIFIIVLVIAVLVARFIVARFTKVPKAFQKITLLVTLPKESI